MTKPIKHRASKAAVVLSRGPDRSSLFYWMVDHHQELAAIGAAQRICWAHVCEIVQALGLTDLAGKPPSASTARKTWYRARIAVRRQSQDQPQHDPAAMVQPMRLAVPQPTLAAPAPPPPQYAPPRSRPTGETEAEAKARADAEIARMLRRIAEASGRIPPQRS